jgi:hypothetical protein
MYRTLLILLITAFITAGLLSCGPTFKGFKHTDFTKPMTLAIMPFNNMSNDFNAQTEFRELFFFGMIDKGYTLVPIPIVDSILLTIGISDGGQLSAIKTSELCRTLKVEGVVVGDITKAQQLTTGVYNKNCFGARLKIFAQDVLVWADSTEKCAKQLGLSKEAMADAVIKRTSGKMTQKVQGHPLQGFMEQVAYEFQNSMPGKRVEDSGW